MRTCKPIERAAKIAFHLVAAWCWTAVCRAESLEASAQAYIGMFEGTRDSPKPSAYPELADRIRTLFPVSGTVMVKTWSKGGRSPSARDTIYVGHDQIEIAASSHEWNLSIDEDHVYEWKEGDADGIRIRRSNKDLVAYLYYLTDPSWIMAGMYSEYLRSPKSASIKGTSSEGFSEIVFQKPIDGFEAIYVTRMPLWFYGFRAKNSDGEFEFRTSKPILVDEIPPSVRNRREKIRFKDSGETLEQRMAFL